MIPPPPTSYPTSWDYGTYSLVVGAPACRTVGLGSNGENPRTKKPALQTHTESIAFTYGICNTAADHISTGRYIPSLDATERRRQGG